MSKVAVIGAGNVGATLALRIAEANLADVAMVDIAGDLCRGKAMDMIDAAPVAGHNRLITAGSDYKAIEGSKVVVITAGFPRLPGMTREELVAKNSSIVKEAVKNVKALAPDAVIIVVTNPLDVMTYIAYKESGFPRGRVMGMAGVLDTARFKALIAAEVNCTYQDIEAYVIGSHGDTMVPLISHTKIKGSPISKFMSAEKIGQVVERTKNRGAQIVALLKSGSAYYAPSASVAAMVKAILNNTNEVLCVSCILDGEYGLRDICIGVPAKIAGSGIQKIIELPLDEAEKNEFERSVGAIRETIGKI